MSNEDDIDPHADAGFIPATQALWDGDLPAAVTATKNNVWLSALSPVLQAAVELVCSPGWEPFSEEEVALEQALRVNGWVSKTGGSHE